MSSSNVVALPSRAVPEPLAGQVRPIDALDSLVASFQRFGVLTDRRSMIDTLLAGLEAGHLDQGSASTVRAVLSLIASSDSF